MDLIRKGEVLALEPTPASPEQELQATPFQLPEKPLVVIEAGKSRLASYFHDLWIYRELLYFLTWRDVKVRYKQTVLGIAWVLLQPLLTTTIFTIFFGNLAQVPSDNLPYPLFVYSVMLPWTFFASSLTNSGNSLVTNANLITKVYFPRMIIPAAAIAARFVDFAVGFVVLIGMMVFYNVSPTTSILMLPILVLLVALLTLGFGMWTSALNVKYRDIGVILPVLVQLWMFASPVVYPSSLVPDKYRWVYELNPMTGILEGFRASLLGQRFQWRALGI